MTPIVTAVLSLTLQQSAVPPPVEQFTAHCAAPVYASDRLICSDPEMLAAEARIGELWRAVEADWSPRPWLEQQDAWFRRRALCAFQMDHRSCLLGANAERTGVLSAAATGPGRTAPAARCTGNGISQLLILNRNNQALAAYDQGVLAWLAIRAEMHWKPFVSWEAGRSPTVQQLDGAKLRCRIRP